MGSATINLAAVIDTLGGTTPAPLRFTAQVMRGGQPALRADGAQAILPAQLTCYWSGTAWSAQPTLTDVDLDCYWQVELASVDGSARLIRSVVLPTGHAGAVNYGDLVQIDPATLTPTANTVAGWAATQALAQQVQTEFANLVAGAPSALDTFLELANQLGSDESAAAALATLVATKQNATQVAAAIAAQAAADSGTYLPLPAGTKNTGYAPVVQANGSVAWAAVSAGGGTSIVDNGDGTLSSTSSSIVDNGDGTLSAA